MAQFNPLFDAYIANAADFAKPILEHWRKVVHENCPEVEETIKWGYPHFDYKGGFMGVMGAYKKHCTFTFPKAELMNDPLVKNNRELKPEERFLGKITSLSDLPSNSKFASLIKEAMALNDQGIKKSATKSDKPKVLELPDYLADRLAENPKAKEVFESKSDSFRKEYILWITDAKTETTRDKRMNEAIEWIAEGKSRYWKYAK